jgi:hypothetical protein
MPNFRGSRGWARVTQCFCPARVGGVTVVCTWVLCVVFPLTVVVFVVVVVDLVAPLGEVVVWVTQRVLDEVGAGCRSGGTEAGALGVAVSGRMKWRAPGASWRA